MVVVAIWATLSEPADFRLEPTDRSYMVHVEPGQFRVYRIRNIQGIEPVDFKFDNRTYELDGYWIDQFEVTEGDWASYGLKNPPAQLIYPSFEKNRGADYPVRWVTYSQAQAYAQSLFKRLPSNLEWQRAAQGPAESALPWGEAYIAAANTGDVWDQIGANPRVTRVGLFERGRSQVGTYDMVGNVWEWTSGDPHGAFNRDRFKGVVGDDLRIVRGAAFNAEMAGTNAIWEKLESRRQSRAWDLGFRCVISDSEIDFQELVIPLIRDLAWRDPWRWLSRTRPASRKLLNLGAKALPYLQAASQSCQDERVCERIDTLIKRINKGS